MQQKVRFLTKGQEAYIVQRIEGRQHLVHAKCVKVDNDGWTGTFAVDKSNGRLVHTKRWYTADEVSEWELQRDLAREAERDPRICDDSEYIKPMSTESPLDLGIDGAMESSGVYALLYRGARTGKTTVDVRFFALNVYGQRKSTTHGVILDSREQVKTLIVALGRFLTQWPEPEPLVAPPGDPNTD